MTSHDVVSNIHQSLMNGLAVGLVLIPVLLSVLPLPEAPHLQHSDIHEEAEKDGVQKVDPEEGVSYDMDVGVVAP
jgi:hypothetical protein